MLKFIKSFYKKNCYLRLIKIRLQYDTQLINEGWEFKWRPFRKPLKIPMFEGRGGDIWNITKLETRTNAADFAAFNWYFWEKQDNCTEENNTLVTVYWKYGKKKYIWAERL